MSTIDIISFILYKDGKFLYEKRKMNKKTDPGKIVLPGGHIEEGESPYEACIREMKEEVGLTSDEKRLVCMLPHTDIDSGQKYNVYYFLFEKCEGELENNEAEELIWSDNIDMLDLKVDKEALIEVERMSKKSANE